MISLLAALLPWTFMEVEATQRKDVSALQLPATESIPSETYLAPVFCSLADHYVMILIQGDTKRNTILSMAHRVYPKTEKKISEHLQNVWTDLKPKLKSVPETFDDALHIGLINGTENHRMDEGSRHCLNLMTIEKYVGQYQIVNPLNGEYLAGQRYKKNEPSLLKRPTRNLVMRWQFPARKVTPHKLPMEVNLLVNTAEGTQGFTTSNNHEQKVALSVDQNFRVNVNIDSFIEDYLKQEKIALNIKELPQISRVYRAWVYLDKGRAYGLQMNDRLVLDTDKTKVKGHVVGYFGPEANIKSPRGYAIQEGAIVFIRKGQDETKVGQVLSYDERKYP